MMPGFHMGRLHLICATSHNFKVEVGDYTTTQLLTEEHLPPIADVYIGNFMRLMWTGDWLETFELCYPENPWEVPMWMEYNTEGELILQKNVTDGNFIGNVCIDRDNDYYLTYKFLGDI